MSTPTRGFGLLGYALALRAAMSYEELLREPILGPSASRGPIAEGGPDISQRSR